MSPTWPCSKEVRVRSRFLIFMASFKGDMGTYNINIHISLKVYFNLFMYSNNGCSFGQKRKSSRFWETPRKNAPHDATSLRWDTAQWGHI